MNFVFKIIILLLNLIEKKIFPIENYTFSMLHLPSVGSLCFKNVCKNTLQLSSKLYL